MPKITKHLRTGLPVTAEVLALIDAVDDAAEAFLTSCVHFTRYMQLDVESGVALDVLKAMTEEIYAKLAFYEKRVDPISGKPQMDQEEPPQSTTARFVR